MSRHAVGFCASLAVSSARVGLVTLGQVRTSVPLTTRRELALRNPESEFWVADQVLDG